MIQFLINRRFRSRRAALRSDSATNHQEAANELRREERAYERELQSLPTAELAELYDKEFELERPEILAQAERADIGRFFSRKSADADFEYWSKSATWYLDEAVALTLGKDPRVVDWDKLEGLIGVSPFAVRYSRLRSLTSRARDHGDLYNPISPGRYLAWLKRNQIDLPPELEEELARRGHDVSDWKTRHDALVTKAASERAGLQEQIDRLRAELEEVRSREKDLSTKERMSLLKMIGGMAMAYHGFDADAVQRGTREVNDELMRVGVVLDDDTVRKWLKAASEILPRDPPS